jgi:DNA-binding NtrC family response regulator
VRDALERNRWAIQRTADELGISRFALKRLMEKLGLGGKG